jgi:hypothetical protein
VKLAAISSPLGEASAAAATCYRIADRRAACREVVQRYHGIPATPSRRHAHRPVAAADQLIVTSPERPIVNTSPISSRARVVARINDAARVHWIGAVETRLGIVGR